MSEYPSQIYRIGRDNLVLAVEALYDIPDMGKESRDNPLEAPGYSRCKITLIDKTGNRVIYPYANVPEDDIYYIKSLTDLALQRLQLVSSTEDLSSEAFTQRFRSGQYKNLTPAEVLQKNPEAKNHLAEYQDQLLRNGTKFSKNSALAKGIGQALKLYAQGDLPEAGQGPFSIYNEKSKFLLSTRNAEERCLVYDISMCCDPIQSEPFEIQIRNYYAFLFRRSDSSLYHVNHESAVDVVLSVIRLSPKEFISMINKMFYSMRDFNTVNFSRRYNYAQALRKKARAAAKEARDAARQDKKTS